MSSSLKEKKITAKRVNNFFSRKSLIIATQLNIFKEKKSNRFNFDPKKLLLILKRLFI